jgi:S1-C subfamily serine protease
LADAGVAFSSPDDAPNVIDFNNRGVYVRAIAYDQGDLLHILRQTPIPDGAPAADKVRETLQALEDEYPVVKLVLNESEDRASFTVSAEQFEPSYAIEDIFWRTADLVVSVAKDGYRRLSPHTEHEEQADSQKAWVAKVEEELRKGSATETTDSAAVFSAVKASLAFVVTDGGNATAFCVASDAQASYYVTNAHVVKDSKGVVLYRQRPYFEKMPGTVVAQGKPNGIDLAVIQVATSGIAPLKLQDSMPKDETQIGVAGYPRVQLKFADVCGELVPAIHLGTITAVVEGGAGILHDALSRPGSSGGPVFDVASGEVIGVHSAGWVEEEQFYCVGAAAALAPFLIEHKVVIKHES